MSSSLNDLFSGAFYKEGVGYDNYDPQNKNLEESKIKLAWKIIRGSLFLIAFVVIIDAFAKTENLKIVAPIAASAVSGVIGFYYGGKKKND